MSLRDYSQDYHPDIGGGIEDSFVHKLAFVFRKKTNDWQNHFNVQQVNDASGTYHYVIEQFETFLKGTIGFWDYRQMQLACTSCDYRDRIIEVPTDFNPNLHVERSPLIELEEYVIEIISTCNPTNIPDLYPQRVVYTIEASDSLEIIAQRFTLAIRGCGYSYIREIKFEEIFDAMNNSDNSDNPDNPDNSDETDGSRREEVSRDSSIPVRTNLSRNSEGEINGVWSTIEPPPFFSLSFSSSHNEGNINNQSDNQEETVNPIFVNFSNNKNENDK